MTRDRRDSMSLTSLYRALVCCDLANVVPNSATVTRDYPILHFGSAVCTGFQEPRDEPGERGRLAGAEFDRPAQCRRDEAEARHLLRRVGALGGAGAQALENGAAKLLSNHPADDIDGADQRGAARKPAQ